MRPSGSPASRAPASARSPSLVLGDAVEPRDIGQQRPERRGRSHEQPGERLVVPGRFQPTLPQMDQVALGLDLARAAKLIERHRRATEWRFSDNDDVAVHDGLVLDRKCVERTAELRHGEQ